LQPKSFATHFRADVGSEADLVCGKVEARGAVEAVTIEQSHGGHAASGADGD